MFRVMTTAAALVAAVIAAPSASAETSRVTVTPLTIDVTVGPDDDTRCSVTADLYRPASATRDAPAPAILTTHGFGGSKRGSDQVAIGEGFAREGYVVMTYSSLGFGGSGCKIYLDDPDWDGEAGSQLIDVLAGAKTATDEETGEPVTIDFVRLDAPGDPRVGMVGGSYGGQNQYAVAAVSQKVDALVPLVTWNDLTYSLAPNNSGLGGGVSPSVPGVHKKQWTSLFFGQGIVNGVQGVTVDPSRMAGCPNFHDPVCAAKAQLEALGYPSPETTALARHASVASYLDQITAPTLLLQGQRDTLFNLQEAAATYRALKAQGTPVSMIWHSFGHSGGQQKPELDLQADNVRDSHLGARIADWFDRWLRDDESAPTGPEFSYFRDWVFDDTGDVAEAYASAEAYPVGRAVPFYLSGNDGLTPSRNAVTAGQQSFAAAPGGAPTSYSETSALEGNAVNNPPSDTTGTFGAWTSPPLAGPLSIVGAPTLEVRLSAPSAELSQA
ncbi:MAG: alpha/beta fold hydrolase, partial [Micromonosporaceae bacterium]|nr:alpha/beta fold hydrolase [Micromonosporaceae bacterium]